MDGTPPIPSRGDRSHRVDSPGELLRLIRTRSTVTRAELASLTGLARSTVSQRIDWLLARDLVREVGEGPSTGGRPPTMLTFNDQAGVVLAADLGATHSRVAVTDLAGGMLADQAEDFPIDRGPDKVLGWLQATLQGLLTDCGRDASEVLGVGIGLPGPVEHGTGQPVNPPIMPGWHRTPVPEAVQATFPVPVLVDNDVNIMALGEHWGVWPHTDDLLYIKVGTGIGCGIVAGGRIHRGAQGAAGDLGHIRVSGYDDVVCRCGNLGCVEAVAGGAALARRLTERGVAAADSRDVARLVKAGDPEAVQLAREAGRLLGQVLAASVNLLNPAVIVIGGDVARNNEPLFAGVRETVYQRSLPLATRHLQIVSSDLDDLAGVTGAAAMVIEHVLSPALLDEAASGDRSAQITASRRR